MKRLWFAWRYLFRPPWDTGISPPELVRTLHGLAPGRALDLGCGTGTNLLHFVEHGWQATGIDFAPNAVARARRRLRGRPARALVGDVSRLDDLPLDGPFDLALDIGCLHGLDEAGRRRYAGAAGAAGRPIPAVCLAAGRRPAAGPVARGCRGAVCPALQPHALRGRRGEAVGVALDG